MTYWKRLTTALLTLVSAFIFTFHDAAPAQAATTEATDVLQKYAPQLLELKASYDKLAPQLKEGTWEQVEKTLPGLNKSFRSLVGTLAKKAPPEVQEKLSPIIADVTSYFDELDTAQTSYKTAKSTYKKAKSTYKKEVESDFDEIDDSLDDLLKFLPKAPKTPKV